MTKIVMFGDPDSTKDAVAIQDAIAKYEQNVDQYVFLGDGAYHETQDKFIALLQKYYGTKKDKLLISLGNHDHEESEAPETEEAFIDFMPDQGKSQPEFDSTDQSWENTKWLTARHLGDIFIISMNSQDMDIEFKRNQYSWVMKQLGTAQSLRQQGKINWIIGCVHKPWFTLKSSHSPYTAVREVYSDAFKGVVDQMWHGHNHNDQAWFPMIAIKESGNAAGKPLFSLAADGKTLDFTKEHGWTTNIDGHSGHEHNKFKETATANKNVMWANDKTFSYAVVESNPQTKILNTKWKDVSGKVLFEYNITRAAAGSVPTQPPPTQPPPTQPPPTQPPTTPPSGEEKPPIPAPAEGFKWDPVRKAWIPIMEHPAFIPDDDEPGPNPPPPPTPVPPPPNNPTGEIDQMGIKWLVAKGKQSMIKQTRDEADDDRWSGNVTGLKQGVEMTMIAKSTGVASDGHFACKHGGGNHSGGNAPKQRWYDTGLRSNGSVQLQWEGPHPKNHSFSLPDGKFFIKSIGKNLEGNYYIGLKWILQTVKPDASPANGGIRCRLYVDKDAIGPDGKPRNNWELVYDFIDGVDAKVIQPQTYQMPDEMDCEIRRSGHKSHQVYGGGLHVRALGNISSSTPPPPPPPPPPPTGGGEKVLWDSDIYLKTGKPYIIQDTYGDQKPDGKGVFMAASGSPRLLVDPDGTFHLQADAGHGRVYIKAKNYNARMEGECCFEDNIVRNTTWRLRSRHNMGGNCENRFGGFGATCERAEQLAEYATEPCHNLHENTIKKPLAKHLEVGKWFKFRYQVCDSPDGKQVLFKTQYDYMDGKGWVTVLEGKHPNPKPYYMDKASFQQESYAWLRINNEKTGKVGYRHVRIVEISSIT